MGIRGFVAGVIVGAAGLLTVLLLLQPPEPKLRGPKAAAGRRTASGGSHLGKGEATKHAVVAGIVVTSEGIPVGSALVRVVPARPGFPPKWEAVGAPWDRYVRRAFREAARECSSFFRSSLVARTGRDGHFAFRDLTPGRWRICAVKKNFLPAVSPVVEPGPGETVEQILVLHEGESIAGKVVNAEGKPVGGVAIRARWVEGADLVPPESGYGRGRRLLEAALGAMPADRVTGKDGTFLFPALTGGWYDLIAVRRGYARTVKRRVFAGSQEVVIALQEGWDLRGVVRSEDGAPLAGAQITTFGPVESVTQGLSPETLLGSGEYETRWGAESDQSGAFIIRDLPAGRYAVLVRREQFQPAVFFGVDVGPGLNGRVSFSLSRGFLLRGVVVSEEGKPLAGAQVTAVAQVSPREPAVRRFESRTDARGGFAFTSLYQVNYRLSVHCEGYVPWSSTVFPDGKQLRIRLRPGLPLQGTVTYKARPVKNARVTFFARRSRGRQKTGSFLQVVGRAFTDRRGFFKLGGLAPGKGILVVEAPGYVEAAREVRIQEPSTAPVKVELRKAGVVRGVVRDSTGKPISGARVHVEALGEKRRSWQDLLPPRRIIARGATDPRGRFQLPLSRAGVFSVRASHPLYLPAASEAFEVPQAGERGPELSLTLSEGLTLRGTIRNREGVPIGGVRIQARLRSRISSSGAHGREVPLGAFLASTVSGPDGSWELKPLAPGVYLIWIDHAPYAPLRREVKVGEQKSPLELVLKPEAFVAGEVVGPDGRPVVGASVVIRGMGVYRQSYTDQKGYFKLGGLAPGCTYVLEVFVPGLRKARLKNVSPGTGSLTIKLQSLSARRHRQDSTRRPEDVR